MSEISANFTKKKNFYLKDDVDRYVTAVEKKLSEKDEKLDSLTKKVAVLEGKVHSMTNGDASLEEKVELYDKLMKKMGDDYQNLLTPAIAKAKLIEEDAEKEAALRIDQAKYSADGIYDKAADRIAETVDANMDRLYDLLDQFIYSKTLAGRVETLVVGCRAVSKKIASGISKAVKVPAKVFCAVSTSVKDKASRFSAAVTAYKDDNNGFVKEEEEVANTETPADDIIIDVAESAQA